MSGSGHSEKHKHCKPDCVSHSSFACSLRKYSSSKSTHYKSIHQENTKSESKQNLHKKKSISYIKPFKEVQQLIVRKQGNKINSCKESSVNIVSGHSKQGCQKSQIESLIMKVSLEAKKKEGSKIQPFILNRDATQKICPQIQETSTKQEVRAHFSQPQALVKAKSQDFKQLQLNVNRIQRIVNLFHKKLEGIESSNASQKQQKKNNNLELSQYTTDQRTPEPELQPIMRPITVQYSISPLLQKKQFNIDSYVPSRDHSKYQLNTQEMTVDKIKSQYLKDQQIEQQKFNQQKERELILFKQNSQKQLNYRMYQNNVGKYGTGSNKKIVSKCHGHSLGI